MFALVIISFGLVAYAYFGYPLILLAASSRKKHPPLEIYEKHPVLNFTIVIAARNEEAVIGQKIENTLAFQAPAAHSRLEIIVASDDSEDRTDDITREYQECGVRLVRVSPRRGKENAQAAAVREASGDVVFFTDSKVAFQPDTVLRLSRYFADPSVGAVSSIDRVIDERGASGEGAYVRYEMWLRRLESAFGTLVGLSGSGFAVRKQLCEKLATDIPSDFSLLLEARRKGYRGVLADDVVGTYRTVASEKEEFSRKVRTVLRGIRTLFARAEVLNPFSYGFFSWQIISHKLIRWLVPWLIIPGVVASFGLADSSGLFRAFSLCIAAFFVFGALGLCNRALVKLPLFKIPAFFIVSNAAILIAWLKFLGGTKSVIWEPSEKR